MSQQTTMTGLDCQKLAQEMAMDNHVSYSTSVRPTKSRTIFRGGIAYLCLGIIGLGYALLLFEFPPVWAYVYIEIFQAVLYCFAGMFLIVCSSNFDKSKYILAGVVVGSITFILSILGTVVAAIGAGYSQTDCECTIKLHGTNSSNVIAEQSCKMCGTTSHLMLYLAITIHGCLQFGAALWVTLHSARLLRYRNNCYAQQLRAP